VDVVGGVLVALRSARAAAGSCRACAVQWRVSVADLPCVTSLFILQGKDVTVWSRGYKLGYESAVYAVLQKHIAVGAASNSAVLSGTHYVVIQLASTAWTTRQAAISTQYQHDFNKNWSLPSMRCHLRVRCQ
jgi:hypothetical protein